MATPKKKMSHKRSRQRRAINLRVNAISGLINCQNCQHKTLPHRICIHCGHYRGKSVE